MAGFEVATEAAAVRGFDKILVDCFAVEGELSTFQRYELGRTLAEYSLIRSRNLKVATVGKLPTMDGFAEQVASNRGLFAQFFLERQAAVNCLNAFSPKSHLRI
jgi:hypothetical protein